MHCKQWIFDMDGTLTDSMTVVWEGAPDALLRRYGRTPRGDLRATLLNMGMQEGAQYLIREYGLPLTEYFSFIVEAQGVLHKSRPEVFFECMSRLGGADPAACAVCEDAVYAAATAHKAGYYVIGIADRTSAADEPEMRRICSQFVPQWDALDWTRV